MGHTFRLGYRTSLDGVRGVAILAVFAFHYRNSDLAFPTRGGFLGVDLFFVLSGFLITSLLYEELNGSGRVSLRGFYARRALRLLPALFVMIGVYLLWAATLGPRHWFSGEAQEAGAALVYAENWFRALAPNYPATGPADGLGPTWSLSVEEQFYVLWPVILIFLFRLGRARVAAIVTGVAFIAMFVVRLALYRSDVREAYFFTRPDGLLVGCFLALILAQGSRRRPPRLIGWIAVGTIAALFVSAEFSSRTLVVYGFSAFALACGVFLWTILTRDDWHVAKLLENRFLTWTGRISYGLYLWQMPVFVAVHRFVPHVRFAAPLAFALTFAVAALSYRFVERPFLRLKSRLSPLRRARSTEQPDPVVTPASLPASSMPAT